MKTARPSIGRELATEELAQAQGGARARSGSIAGVNYLLVRNGGHAALFAAGSHGAIFVNV